MATSTTFRRGLTRRSLLRGTTVAAAALGAQALMAACGSSPVATQTPGPAKVPSPSPQASVPAGLSNTTGAATQVATAPTGGATAQGAATGAAQAKPTAGPAGTAAPGSAPPNPSPASGGSPTPATGGSGATPAAGSAAAPAGPSTAQAGAATASANITPSAGGTAAAKPAAAPAALPTPGNMPAGSFMKSIQDKGKLTAGVKTDVLLFGYLNPRTNKIEGFDVDLCKEIAKAIFGDPEKIDLKEVTSASRIPSLQQGIVDVVAATMTITKDRLTQIDMSDVYYEAGQKLLVPKNSAIKSIQDTAGKKICAAKGSTSETNITKFQAQAQVVQADKYTDCLLAMQQGRTDGISTDDAILAGLAEQDPNTQIVGDRFTQEPYGIGLAKGKEGWLAFVNGVMADVKKSGRWDALYKQWLGKYLPTVPPPTRTAQEAAV